MKSTNRSIEFFYQYRDTGNYKKYNSIVFSNPGNIVNLTTLEKEIREQFFDTEFFYPYLVNVPLIHFDDWDPELDHHWYHFESLALTEIPPNDKHSRTIGQFVEDLKKYAQTYEA